MAPILSARAVGKTYRTGTQEVHALHDVSMDIEPGEMVMVMGPSGNGKTTLLNCLSGLDDIDRGEVYVDGEEIHSMPDARRTEHRARRMGFIFQSFNLIPVFTALENVELPLLVTGIRAGEARERSAAMLERMGLADRTGHRPTELSGGEQQRVAIARALVSGPAIVWADEPTGNLDSQTADSVLELLYEVHQRGQTLVIVTHDAGIGASGTRLVQMRDGGIVYDGPPAGEQSGQQLRDQSRGSSGKTDGMADGARRSDGSATPDGSEVPRTETVRERRGRAAAAWVDKAISSAMKDLDT